MNTICQELCYELKINNKEDSVPVTLVFTILRKIYKYKVLFKPFRFPKKLKFNGKGTEKLKLACILDGNINWLRWFFSRVYFCQKPSIHMLTQAIQFLEIHPKKKKKWSYTKIYLKEISSHNFYNIKIGNYLKINNKEFGQIICYLWLFSAWPFKIMLLMRWDYISYAVNFFFLRLQSNIQNKAIFIKKNFLCGEMNWQKPPSLSPSVVGQESK